MGKYKVIYTQDAKVIMPVVEYPLSTEIILGKGRLMKGFETEEEALAFIEENGLKYDRESMLPLL